MRTLFQRFFDAIDFKITGGSEHLWSCWQSARYFDASNEFGVASMIADPISGTVYQITAYKKGDNITPYRWLNPLFHMAFSSECKERRIDENIAWDEVNYADTDSEDDILEKVRAVLNNIAFDERVVLNIDLDEVTLARVALLAHAEGVTLNDYMIRALKAVCSERIDNVAKTSCIKE